MKTLALLLALVAAALAAQPAPAGGTPRSSTATSAAPTEGAPSSDTSPPSASDAAPGRPQRPDLGPTGEARPTSDASPPPAVTAAPQPERLNAAVTALVEGVWELVAVSELPPASEELVFARVVFAEGEMTTTTVYLDPDDGDLAGRSRRDRFFAADGQLLTRDGFRTRVLDVQPDPQDRDRIVLRDVQERIAMVLRRVDARVERDPALYGTWRTGPPDRDAPLTLAFGADGQATGADDGDAFRVDYVVAGAYLILDNRTTYRYTVTGDRLVLEHGDELLLLARTAP